MAVYTEVSQIPLFRYGMIHADPPWLYALRSKAGVAKSPQAKYECMPLDQIKALPVDMMASKDCWLWLWVTNPMLPKGLEVMDAWGFTYVTGGHWVKRSKHGKLNFGTGYVLRSSGEPYLIGKIGNPKSCSKSIRSIIEASVREHSRKPEEAYKNCELLAGKSWRLDLFSREERAGWDSFGNEVGKFASSEAVA